jgi:hypothetical protein
MRVAYPKAMRAIKSEYEPATGETKAQTANKLRDIAMDLVFGTYRQIKDGVGDGIPPSELEKDGVPRELIELFLKKRKRTKAKRGAYVYKFGASTPSKPHRKTGLPSVKRNIVIVQDAPRKQKKRSAMSRTLFGKMQKFKLGEFARKRKKAKASNKTKLEAELEAMSRAVPTRKSPVKLRERSKLKKPDRFTYDTWDYEDWSKSISTGKGRGSFPTWKWVAGKSGLKTKTGAGLLRGGRAELRSNLLRFKPDFTFRASKAPRKIKQTSGNKAIMNMNQFTNFYPKRYLAGKPSRFRTRSRSFVKGSVVAAKTFRPKGPLINLRDPNKYPLDRNYKSDAMMKRELEYQTKLFEAKYAAQRRYGAPSTVVNNNITPGNLAAAQLAGVAPPSQARMPQQGWNFARPIAPRTYRNPAVVQPEPVSAWEDPAQHEGIQEGYVPEFQPPSPILIRQQQGIRLPDPAGEEGEEDPEVEDVLSRMKELHERRQNIVKSPEVAERLRQREEEGQAAKYFESDRGPSSLSVSQSIEGEEENEEKNEMKNRIGFLRTNAREVRKEANMVQNQMDGLDQSMDITESPEVLLILRNEKDSLSADYERLMNQWRDLNRESLLLEAEYGRKYGESSGSGYQERLRDRVRRARAIKYGSGRRGGAFRGFSETLYRAVPAMRGFVGDEIYEVEREVLI